MTRRFLVALASVLLLVTAAAPVGAREADTATGEKVFTKGGTFLVQLAELPVVAYDGSTKGFRATRPAPGTKIDPASADVTKYVDFLKSRHAAVLRAAGVEVGRKLYSYAYSYNGFAATLTAAQANRLAVAGGVVTVSRDRLYEVDTSSTPAFLGLTPGGEDDLWDLNGGPTGTKTIDGAGEDVVIGVVDSGVWPESLSFSDRNADDELIYSNLLPQSFHGKCDGADKVIDPNWDASKCNKKLIAAQHFNAAWGGNAGLEAQRPWEFASPRDYNGHGTHTASTSGGNFGVPTTQDAVVVGAAISGIAPRARIAVYKALWSNEDASVASGFGADLVAAIDQAVADGVDVINYSVSGTNSNFLDGAEVAFLFAAQAGIFVSASAGNAGTVGSVAHPSPWITTVAAGTHNRNGLGSVTLGNNATYNGASLASAVGPAPLVDSIAAGLAGADATKLGLCYAASDNAGVAVLDPAKVAGKIVVCDRGVTGRTNKSLAVMQAGGVGMILVNPTNNSINADLHWVPTVHVNNDVRDAIKTYAATSATATINDSSIVLNDPAPSTAAFSSRGPLVAGGGDLLKPDVMAPGNDVLAAVSPAGNHGRDFNIYSGTSMSAPHVAGLAALLKDLKPGWTPARIKSALMTTAYDVIDPGISDATRTFRQGAGHVLPNSAADPGLVFDNGFDDWRGFLRSQGLCTLCLGTTPAPVFDSSDFNGASIAIGDMAGIQTVTRRVTNVGGSAATYNVNVDEPAGIDVNVNPETLEIGAGASATFTVTFTTTSDATQNAYAGGSLTWSDGDHDVRVPIVIRPVPLSAPRQVSGTGGPITYNVMFGYGGPFNATPRGLIAAETASRTVLDDPTDGACSLTSPNAQIHEIAVPAGTTYAQFSLFDAFTDGNDDLDMCVFNAAGANVGGSGSGTSAEEVNLVAPAAGAYRVVVQGWGTDGPSADYTLFWWLLDSTDAGNMTVTAPALAVVGQTAPIELTFSGLAAGTKYLGSVAYSDGANAIGTTIVRVDTP